MTDKASPRFDSIAVRQQDDGVRIDRWFHKQYPDLGYGALQKLLRSGQIRVDSRRVKADTRLAAGQQVRVPPHVRPRPGAAPSLKPPPGL